MELFMYNDVWILNVFSTPRRNQYAFKPTADDGKGDAKLKRTDVQDFVVTEKMKKAARLLAEVRARTNNTAIGSGNSTPGHWKRNVPRKQTPQESLKVLDGGHTSKWQSTIG